MATVLSTTETELIGFQSQLCRVSYQSVPRPPTPSSISPLRPPPLEVPHSWLFLSSQQPSVNDAVLEMRHELTRIWPIVVSVYLGYFLAASAVYVRVVFNEDSELGAARRGSLLALKGVKGRE